MKREWRLSQNKKNTTLLTLSSFKLLKFFEFICSQVWSELLQTATDSQEKQNVYQYYVKLTWWFASFLVCTSSNSKTVRAFLHADKEQLHFMVVSNVTNQTLTTLPSPSAADWLFSVLYGGCFRAFTCLEKKGPARKIHEKNLLRPDKSWNDSLKYKHILTSGQPSASCVPAFALYVVPSPLSVISSRVMSFECLNDAHPISSSSYSSSSSAPLLFNFLAEETLYLYRRVPSTRTSAPHCTVPVPPSRWWKITPLIYSVILGSHNGPLKRIIWATNLRGKRHFNWLLEFDHMPALRSFISASNRMNIHAH